MAKNRDNTLVQVPAWVLMMKVEQDWNEWKVLNSGSLDEEDDDVDDKTPFPEYDSTMKCLEILKTVGISFETSTGKWK